MNNIKNMLSILLAAVLGAQTCCYANDGSSSVSNNIIEVKDIQLAKVEESGLRVFGGAKGNKLYYIAFTEADNCHNPIIELSNKQGITTPSSQKNNSGDLGLLDVDLKGYKAWKIANSIIKENVAKEDAPVAYSVKFGSGSGTNCQAMTGTMPELQVSLDPTIEPDGSRTVILTNVSSSGITITGIEENEFERDDEKVITDKGVNPADFADKYIGIDGALRFPLKPMESCFPSVTGKIVNNGFYRFTIGYKIDGEANTQDSEHKFEIYVFRSCVTEDESEEISQDQKKEERLISYIQKVAVSKVVEPSDKARIIAEGLTKDFSVTPKVSDVDKVIIAINELQKDIKKIYSEIRKDDYENASKLLSALERRIYDLENSYDTKGFENDLGLCSWHSRYTWYGCYQIFSSQKVQSDNLKRELENSVNCISDFKKRFDNIMLDVSNAGKANSADVQNINRLKTDLEQVLSKTQEEMKDLGIPSLVFIDSVKEKVRKELEEVVAYGVVLQKFVDVNGSYNVAVNGMDDAIKKFDFANAIRLIDKIKGDKQYRTSSLAFGLHDVIDLALFDKKRVALIGLVRAGSKLQQDIADVKTTIGQKQYEAARTSLNALEGTLENKNPDIIRFKADLGLHSNMVFSSQNNEVSNLRSNLDVLLATTEKTRKEEEARKSAEVAEKARKAAQAAGKAAAVEITLPDATQGDLF